MGRQVFSSVMGAVQGVEVCQPAGTVWTAWLGVRNRYNKLR